MNNSDLNFNNIRHKSVRKKTASRICSTQVLYGASFVESEIDSLIKSYVVTDNNETKYACTTHVKKFTKKKKLNSNYDLFKISQIMVDELNSKTDFSLRDIS